MLELAFLFGAALSVPSAQMKRIERRRGWRSAVAPTVTIGELSADVGRKIAIDQRIIATRISVEPPRTPTESLEHAGLPQHPLHVLLGLGVGRDSLVKIDGSLTRIVGRDSHGDVPPITVEQISQVPDATPDVLTRVESVRHAES